MILFLYGDEPWLVRDKLHQIVDKADSQGVDAANTTDFDADAAPAAIREAALAAPFIAKQRLVILRNWLLERSAADAEPIIELLPQVPASTILVVTEFGLPDQRRAAFKALLKAAGKTWRFARLDEAAAARWAVRYAADHRGELPASAARYLVGLVGTDLWSLATEIDKLTSASSQPVTTDLIDQLVVEAMPSDIFALVDAIGGRQAKAALQQYRQLIDAGEPALRVMAMVVRQFRIMLGVGSLRAGGKSEAAIAKELRLHPFVAKKAVAQSQSFTERELRTLFDTLAELDYQIKTGAREAEPALELFIVETTTAPAPGAGHRY